MKSKLFKRGSTFIADNQNQLHLISKIRQEEFSKCLELFVANMYSIGEAMPVKIAETYPDLSYPANEIVQSIQSCIALHKFCKEKEDDIDNIITDLIDSKYIDQNDRDLFISNYNFVRSVLDTKFEKALSREETTGYLKRISAFSFNCQILPKFHPEYHPSKTKIEEYEPQITDLFSVVRGEFRCEGIVNEDEGFEFYITREEIIDKMIDALFAVKIEMNQIKQIVLNNSKA